MPRLIPVFLAGSVFLSLSSLAVAEETASEATSETAPRVGLPPEEPATDVETSQNSRASKNKKGKAPREKDTEGTEAPDRFEADTVIKSEYELDGKKLEVDPD